VSAGAGLALSENLHHAARF